MPNSPVFECLLNTGPPDHTKKMAAIFFSNVHWFGIWMVGLEHKKIEIRTKMSSFSIVGTIARAKTIAWPFENRTIWNSEIWSSKSSDFKCYRFGMVGFQIPTKLNNMSSYSPKFATLSRILSFNYL